MVFLVFFQKTNTDFAAWVVPPLEKRGYLMTGHNLLLGWFGGNVGFEPNIDFYI
jgi:hypothetical protein